MAALSEFSSSDIGAAVSIIAQWCFPFFRQHMGRLESESEASRGRTDAEARIVTNEMQMSRRTECHATPKTILIVKIMDAKGAKEVTRCSGPYFVA